VCRVDVRHCLAHHLILMVMLTLPGA
jgi:hypothetical protein